MVSKSEVALVKSEDLKAADAVGVVAAWRNRDQGQALNDAVRRNRKLQMTRNRWKAESMEGGEGRRNRWRSAAAVCGFWRVDECF